MFINLQLLSVSRLIFFDMHDRFQDFFMVRIFINLVITSFFMAAYKFPPDFFDIFTCNIGSNHKFRRKQISMNYVICMLTEVGFFYQIDWLRWSTCRLRFFGWLLDHVIYLKLKVIYPKYSKHWLSTVTHTVDCVCSKILNHGLNHGLFFQVFWMKKTF